MEKETERTSTDDLPTNLVEDLGQSHEEMVEPTNTTFPISNASGLVFFQDNLSSVDMLQIDTFNLQPLPVGDSYNAWLIGDDGSAILLGVLPQSQDIFASLKYTSPNGINLLAAHNRVFITIESENASTPSQKTILDGSYPQEDLALIRSLMVRNNGNPPTPRSKPFLEGIKSEFDLALQHIQNAINAQAIGASDQSVVHLEHVVNILDGSNGDLFRDYNSDGTAENPGDGFGMLVYIRQVAEKVNKPEIIASADELETQIFNLQLEIISVINESPTTTTLESIMTRGETIRDGIFGIFLKLIQQATALELRPAK